MKFVTNTISTKTNVPTLAEMYKAAQTKAALSKAASAKPQVTKTSSQAVASEEIEIELKVANVANFGDKKAKPFGKKDDHSEAEIEVEKEVGKKDKKDKKATATLSVKVAEEEEAESSGQLDPEPLHQKGESTGEKPGSLDTMKTDKGGKSGGGKKSDCEEGKSSGQPEAEAKLVNHPKVDKDAGAKGTQKSAFKKIAELTAEEKEFLRNVWSNFWPKAFIDAILKPQ